MNLLRKGTSPFVSFYLNAPKQGFVGLRTETVKVLKKIATPKKYYEELLKETPVDSKGILALNPTYLNTMVNKCETAEDIDITVSAYYNFLGHYVRFGDNEVDNLLRKSIECKNPQATTDILANHNYLGYYPHPSVLEGIAKYYRENNLVDDAKKLLKSTENRKLLKLSPAFFDEVLTLAQEAKDTELAGLAYKQARGFGVQLSLNSFRSLIEALYQSKANGGVRSNLSAEILEAAQKYDLTAQDQIKLSFSLLHHPEDAIRSFESLAGSNLELAGREYVLADSELTRNYIEQIYTTIADKAKFQYRFSEALKTLGGKYNERAIEKGLNTLIQENEQKLAQWRADKKAQSQSKSKPAEEPQQAEEPK